MKKLAFTTLAIAISTTGHAAPPYPVFSAPLGVRYEVSCLTPLVWGTPTLAFGGWVYDWPVDNVYDFAILTLKGVLILDLGSGVLFRMTFDLSNAIVPAAITSFPTGTVTNEVYLPTTGSWIPYNVVDASVTNIDFTPGQTDPCGLTTTGLQLTTFPNPWPLPGLSGPAAAVMPGGLMGGAIHLSGTVN